MLGRVIGAGLAGAALAVPYAIGTDAAFAAHSREWDMGGIPLLLSSLLFVGFLTGVTAGVAAPRRPYLAAAIGTIAVTVAGILLDAYDLNSDLLSPAWAPLGLVAAWWGALVVDPLPAGRAARLTLLRNASYLPAWFVSFFALLGPAIHYVPRFGGWLAALIPAAFFIAVAARNRRRPDRGLGATTT